MRRFGWKHLLLLYAVLLLASHGMRRFTAPEGLGLPGQKMVEVPPVAGDEAVEGEPVSLAYRDVPPEGVEDPPVLVLIHGTPVASRALDNLVDRLKGRYRLIVPDLPGFGGSTRMVPDYSVRAHGRYVLELLDALDIGSAHFLGYSRGGAVLLNIAGIAPERVESLIMASAIGVQEFELFGNYSLNRAIFALQWAGIWLCQEAVPHFGLFDHILLDSAYARNFYDSDLRPHRDYLMKYMGPMLVMHGTGDKLIVHAAAVEHHRLAPQSELVSLEGGHLLIFTRPEVFARAADAFIRRVETGAAATRRTAEPERVAAALQKFDSNTVPPVQGTTLLVAILLIALASWVTVDGACIGAGLLAATGGIDYLPALIACFLGIFSGDILLYLGGRWFGANLLHRAPLRWFVSEQAVEVSESWFQRLGPVLIVITHFTPGTRFPTNFGSGILKLNFWRIAAYFILASALWSLVLVSVTAALGGQVVGYFKLYEKYALPGLILAGVIFYAAVKIAFPMCSWHGRRLLLSKWRKFSRYEFWPLWKFYPPVIAYILYLGIKYRCLTLFTAVNPGMKAGGFIGEDKAALLKSLGDDAEFLPKWTVLRNGLGLEERLALLDEFMGRNGLSYPVALKPDEGQRGVGVSIVRSREQAKGYLKNSAFDTIAQEYVEGCEYGVFYYRLPGEEKGTVFSITDKRFPEVTGDGETTLEHLILGDDRAVCLATLYLDRFVDRLFEIPEKGERIPLVEIGTHCLGALFLDGGHLKSPALAETMDRIGRNFEEFYFGRFDVRAPSPQALLEGRDLKVLEVNGVTSEATHIYDPKHTLDYAYRTFFEQWRIAFEIGARNRRRGVKPMALRELFSYYRKVSRRQREIA